MISVEQKYLWIKAWKSAMKVGTSQYPIILHVSLMKGVTAEKPPDLCHTQNCVARVL